MTTTPQQVRDALDSDMVRLGLTEAELARRVGVSQQAVNKWRRIGVIPVRSYDVQAQRASHVYRRVYDAAVLGLDVLTHTDPERAAQHLEQVALRSSIAVPQAHTAEEIDEEALTEL